MFKRFLLILFSFSITYGAYAPWRVFAAAAADALLIGVGNLAKVVRVGKAAARALLV